MLGRIIRMKTKKPLSTSYQESGNKEDKKIRRIMSSLWVKNGDILSNDHISTFQHEMYKFNKKKDKRNPKSKHRRMLKSTISIVLT